MPTIITSSGYQFKISPEDSALKARYWYASPVTKHSRRPYCCSRHITGGKTTYTTLHREVAVRMGLITSPRWVEDPREIVFRNHDTTDCRRENLMVATPAERRARARRWIRTKTYVGVYETDYHKWEVHLDKNLDRRSYGVYFTQEWAAIVRDIHSQRVHGNADPELNFPNLSPAKREYFRLREKRARIEALLDSVPLGEVQQLGPGRRFYARIPNARGPGLHLHLGGHDTPEQAWATLKRAREYIQACMRQGLGLDA